MSERLVLPIKVWRKDAILPKIATKGDAGADCFINGFKKIAHGAERSLEELNVEEYILKPLDRVLCPLGFATAIPEGYFAAVVPRSGLALWEGISIANTPGTIDSGYRNEWGAIVVNLSNHPVTLHKGEKICQFILRKLENYTFQIMDELPQSKRGLGGFGSTGKK